MSYKATYDVFENKALQFALKIFFTYRGFFCDDENLRHPYVEELISTHACAATYMDCSCSISGHSG